MSKFVHTLCSHLCMYVRKLACKQGGGEKARGVQMNPFSRTKGFLGP